MTSPMSGGPRATSPETEAEAGGRRSAPRVLKSGAAGQLTGTAQYGFFELQERCEQYLESVRQQSRDILSAATDQACSIREQAQQEARQTGFAHGLSLGEEELESRVEARAQQLVEERLQSVLPAIDEAAAGLAQQRDRWLCAWEATAIRLCLSVCERILQARLSAQPDHAQHMIREILQLATGLPEMEVHMNPEDVSQLGEHCEALVRRIAACADARVVADATVARGGCVIHSRHGVIDGRIETQLQRIADELLPA